jgi:hypothetical protein
MTYDNVIIFGAGASANAGIPLMNNFVDTMWRYSVRGRAPNKISEDDRKLLALADEIRVGLEPYNTRANFNMRNLEDILSLLSFEALAGGDALKKYQTWVRAITRTIELSTVHPYQNSHRTAPTYPINLYHIFWDALLGENSTTPPPALITFNYDLVFERTLWDYFHGLSEESNKFKPKRDTCKINYFLRPYDFTIKTQKCDYVIAHNNFNKEYRQVNVRHDGFIPSIEYNCKADIEIPYLKLHGSLNWCSKTTPKQDEQIPDDLVPALLATQSVETPLILPPVFNKMNLGDVSPVWKKALQILREAKHIILVGYSLPKTDIYMQYFLKSAVGPNSGLQKIIVFDPTLFNHNEANDEMRKRYRECFSPQFQEQITFEPKVEHMFDENDRGRLSHFIQTLKNSRDELFFTP